MRRLTKLLRPPSAVGIPLMRTPLARACATGGRSDAPDTVKIGNPANGTIDPVHVSWMDIAGIDTTTAHRLAAGKVLAMLDLCASRSVRTVTEAVSRMRGVPFQAATVGVTSTVFSSAILNGNAIRMDSHVVHGGSCSLGVYIRFYRQSVTMRCEDLAGESFFTMVATDKHLKASRIVPAMKLTDPLDIAMHARFECIRSM